MAEFIDYNFKGIPTGLWEEFSKKSRTEGFTNKTMLLNLIAKYVKEGE